MRYVIEVPNSYAQFIEELFTHMKFIKNLKKIEPNEIQNPEIMEGIVQYEKGEIEATPINLDELKALINA